MPSDTSHIGRIIVAEDNLPVMELLKGYFSQMGLSDRCVFVYNGIDAVLAADRNLERGDRTTHILMDFMMPRLNGIQALEKIQNLFDIHN